MTSSIPQKQCTKCHLFYPATEEYFVKEKRSKSGLTARCKKCAAEYSKQWWENNPDKKKQYQVDGKESHRISSLKYMQRIRKENPNFNHEQYELHKDSRILSIKKWRDNHPEAYKIIVKRYRDKYPDRIRETAKASYLRHIDIRKQHSRISAKKRKHLLRSAEGYFTKDDLMVIYNQQKGCCAYCDKLISWEISGSIHIDHIQPLSKGGNNWPSNLALACAKCNLSKGAKTLDEWIKNNG